MLVSNYTFKINQSNNIRINKCKKTSNDNLIKQPNLCSKLSFGMEAPKSFIDETAQILSNLIGTPMIKFNKEHELYKKVANRQGEIVGSEVNYISQNFFPFKSAYNTQNKVEKDIQFEFDCIRNYKGDNIGEFVQMLYLYANKSYDALSRPKLSIYTTPKFNQIDDALTLQEKENFPTKIVASLGNIDNSKKIQWMTLPPTKVKLKLMESINDNQGQFIVPYNNSSYLVTYSRGFKIEKIRQ